MVQVAGPLDQTGAHQILHHRGAQALDIHGVPTGEVDQMAQELGRALCAGAADVGPILVAGHRRAAHRALLRQVVGLRPLRALLLQHLHNLRNDLSRLLYQHSISDADVLFRDEILIVKGGACDGGAGQTHRLHYGLRRQHAGTPHLNHNVHHPGRLLLRRIFVGRRPAGKFRRTAQGFTFCKAIHLYNRTINVKGVSLSALPHGLDTLCRLGNRFTGVMWNYFKVLFPQVFQGF